MDSDKVSAITGWEIPSNLKDLQAFLRFVNFYRQFIKDFSKTVKLLNHLSKSGVTWD